ncbi:hypothetical protein BU26DRAFT_569291 [Trematosphaeria pertusa]|uniref:Uncharacterized protein n=1 Tax=Trematosphaeria pertusa TaxID=390896 RepID=A0A6A6I3X0_9PLEO|nr:uncharacterized protein BU26DRAFT_569291 [Trematosphaeria pertusa]KAF2244300.1 hypothetical protein BU26DRAFT_569291 [Trematosphaeria pertusa]
MEVVYARVLEEPAHRLLDGSLRHLGVWSESALDGDSAHSHLAPFDSPSIPHILGSGEGIAVESLEVNLGILVQELEQAERTAPAAEIGVPQSIRRLILRHSTFIDAAEESGHVETILDYLQIRVREFRQFPELRIVELEIPQRLHTKADVYQESFEKLGVQLRVRFVT